MAITQQHWDEAPVWANYLAQDANGKIWAYEMEPRLGFRYWVSLDQTRATLCGTDTDTDGWEQSLTKRPDSQPTAQGYVPDWSTAPEKAEFHAIDKDGRGWWYQGEPLALRACWRWPDATEIWRNMDCNMQYGLDGWERSLTKRPAQAPRPARDNRKDKELIDLRVENVALKAQNSALRDEIARLLREKEGS